MAKEFADYKELTKNEIERLKSTVHEVQSAIVATKSEMNSSFFGENTPGGSARNQDESSMNNHTMTSNFTMNTIDVEEMR